MPLFVCEGFPKPAPTALLLNSAPVTGTGPHVELSDLLTSGSLIAQLGAVDPDTGESFTYELIDDADGLFFLSGNLLRRSESGVLDPDAVSYTVTVRVTDSTGLTFTTNIVLGSTAVTNDVRAEGTSGNDVLDFEDAIGNYIIADAGDDTITGDGNDIMVYSGRREDYDITYTPSTGGGYGGYGSEEPGFLTITDLRAGGGDGTDVVVNINSVIFADGQYGADEALGVSNSERIQLDGHSLNINGVVPEHEPTGYVVGQITLAGFDPSEPFTILGFTVSSFPNTTFFSPPHNTGSSFFTINAAGQLVTNAPLDFESYDVHSVSVQIMDPDGNTFTQSLFIQVVDGPDPASSAFLSALTTNPTLPFVAEHSNREDDVEVGRVILTDPDGAAEGYAITVAPEFADRFYVVGDRVFLREGALIDFETEPNVLIDLLVQDLTMRPDQAVRMTVDFDVTFAQLRGDVGDTAITGTAGNDVIIRSTGVTSISGGAGDDTLVGNHPNSVLRWINQGPSDTNIAAGFVQTIGAVQATVEVDLFGTGTASIFGGVIYTGPADPFVSGSHYYTTGGAGPTSTLSVSFSDTNGAIAVTGATFRILDIDAAGWQDIVTIRAYDINGTEISLSLTPNGQDSISGNIITGAFIANEFDDATGSILVTITGAAHRIEVEYANGLTDLQALGITDIHFNAAANGAATGATYFGEAGNDRIIGAGAADTMSGGDGNDVLSGFAGIDSLNGGAGDDVLDGGTSADSMTGGTGNDSYFVNLATDTVAELSNQGSDTINASATWTLVNHFENLTLTGSAAINGTGNSVANVIVGNAGANTLAGLGGNDTITGAAGNDKLIGGAGADALTGGLGNDIYQISDALDTITELVGEGTDLVQAFVDFTLGANLEKLYLLGSALNATGNELANTLIGTSAGNTLSGMAGEDFIYGGGGADVISGGAGRDRMYGEAGADRFVFDDGDFGGASSNTADLLRDFSLVDGDTIDVSAVDAVAGGADDGFSFIGTAAFSNVAGQLRFQTSATATTVMGDLNGDGVADFWIVLTGVHALDAADFVL